MIALIVLCAAFISVRAQGTPPPPEPTTRWTTSRGKLLFQLNEYAGENVVPAIDLPVSIEFGLRSDGVVVWRVPPVEVKKFAHAQQPKEVTKTIDAPIVPDKVALQIRTEQLTQARAASEFNQLIQTDIGKRLVALQNQLNQSAGKLNDLTKGVCGDPKLWALDIDQMKCVASKAEMATKKE